MTQDERWQAKYNEVMDFIETNHRNPSRKDQGDRNFHTLTIHQYTQYIPSGIVI